MPYVGSPAKVDQGPAPVHRGGGRVDLLVQNADLELIVLEHLEQVLLAHFQALERLLLLDDLFDQGLDMREVQV